MWKILLLFLWYFEIYLSKIRQFVLSVKCTLKYSNSQSNFYFILFLQNSNSFQIWAKMYDCGSHIGNHLKNTKTPIRVQTTAHDLPHSWLYLSVQGLGANVLCFTLYITAYHCIVSYGAKNPNNENKEVISWLQNCIRLILT